MESSLDADLELLREAALAAGQLAMTFFRKNPKTWAKEGGSPVTDADLAVDTFLRTRLLAARPHYGWLSEETVDEPSRRQRESIFVVDPVDGTRGFIEGDDRWCVSLAVVRAGRPVVAALAVPARAEFYTAVAGGGARRAEGRLAVGGRGSLLEARLAGPRAWLNSPALRDSGAVFEPHVPSLAYRIAGVATGRFDAAFASPRAHDWDLAASDLLVHEAGGRLAGLDGAMPVYNRESTRHGVLAAANVTLQPKLMDRLAEVVRERDRDGAPHSRERR